MPQTIEMAAFVLGAILLLIALTAGSLSIFGASTQGAAGRWSRAIAGVAGAGLIGFTLWHTQRPAPTPSPADAKAPATGDTAKADTAVPASASSSAKEAAAAPARETAAADKSPPPARPTVMGPLEEGMNRQGNDFSANAPTVDNAAQCAELCRVDPNCTAMTYVISLRTCWLKSGTPVAKPHHDMISSVKVSPTD